MRVKSLSQSVVNATLSVTLSFGLYVSKEDNDASQEVRDFVGEQDGDFYGIHTDTDAHLELCFISNC
jgi:hypothetical protein